MSKKEPRSLIYGGPDHKNYDRQNSTTTALNNGQTFTGESQLNSFPDVLVSIETDTDGVLFFDFSDDGINWNPDPGVGFLIRREEHTVKVAVKGPKYFRIRFTNDSGANQTYLRLFTYYGAFDVVAAMPPKDFFFEVGETSVSNKTFIHKYGRNKDIDTGVFEAIWNGGGFYTGFNATVAETIEVFSAAAADAGTLLSSGTATGGSSTTLIDTGATFITDGVSIGDIIINDDQQFHGIVTVVTSETVLTVFAWDKTPHFPATLSFLSGDSYRIATDASTGLAVLKLEHLLDGALANETSEYIILNGVTAVDTVSTYRRCSRARGVLAGPGDATNNEITVRQKITIANIFCVLPSGANHTTICAYTIPLDKEGHLTGWFASFAGKTQATVNVRLRTRHQGEPFVVREEISISGAGTGYASREYKVPKNDLSPGVDVVIDADTDSNDTGVAAGFDLVLSRH